MSIDEHLQDALQLQQQGKADEALALCGSLILENTDDFRLYFLMGMLYQQLNKIDQAIDHFSAAVDREPRLDSGHYNLGVLYFSQGDYELAVKAYEKAAKLRPDDPDILFNYALTLKTIGDFSAARKQYENVLAQTPEDADTLYNLGVLFRESGETTKATEFFQKTIFIDPCYISAHNNLAYLFHKTGQTEKALASYRKVLELNPSHQSARHMVAALSGETTNSSPLSYIKELFDQFSDDFDEALLSKLQYSTPEKLLQLLESDGDKKHFGNGLDMGCGTGLSGLAFSEKVTRLTGLDLSAGMLEKAKEKKIYSKLEESDIAGFLRQCEETFDFFLAADVFVYLGDLHEVFHLARQKSEPGCHFLFSTEICEENFILQASGRYAHSERYIRNLASKCGFSVKCCITTKLRMEKDEWIKGNLFLCQV